MSTLAPAASQGCSFSLASAHPARGVPVVRRPTPMPFGPPPGPATAGMETKPRAVSNSSRITNNSIIYSALPMCQVFCIISLNANTFLQGRYIKYSHCAERGTEALGCDNQIGPMAKPVAPNFLSKSKARSHLCYHLTE